MEHEVKAAGCVVHRSAVAFAVIHRPKYDDWSLPKGKLDPGESFEDAAVREVEEEIGVRGMLGVELPATEYRDRKGRAKIVRYWLLRADDTPAFEPNDEVDEVRWLGADDARELLTYPRDREILGAAVERLAGSSYRGSTARVATQKRSISFDPEILREAEALARADGSSLSRVVNDALMNQVRLARLRALVTADEEQFGAVSDQTSAAVETQWPDSRSTPAL